MLEILAVDPGSIGEELELEAGDNILSINGNAIRDLLDFQLYIEEEDILLEVRKKDGELWELEFEKDSYDTLGLHFAPPEPSQCGNRCIFCFVHQLPPGMRPSLYVKDEDYRFSFLYGTYVTLSNIDDNALQRIISQRLSPLYVSVHATEPQLRDRLLGRKGMAILDLLKKLTEAGIQIHTQIVVCPGINDGEDLERTVEDLFALHPGILSVAVVPVGLTGYRQRLPDLRPPTKKEAQETLSMLRRLQGRFISEKGSRFVFAADEYYLKAGEDFPPMDEYEGFPQVENGVGLIAQFRAEAEDVLKEATPLQLPSVSTITGVSASRELERFICQLSQKSGVPIYLHTIRNDFFGGHVSVTGLITGRDVIDQLRGRKLGSALFVPDIILKEGEDLFLDDVSLSDLERALGIPVYKIPSTPWGLLEGLESLLD